MQKKFTLTCAVFVMTLLRLQAQSLPVGTLSLEDKYRRDQLLGKLDSNLSFMIRPLTPVALGKDDVFNPDNSYTPAFNNRTYTKDGKGYISLMPITTIIRNTSKYPYGWNDGPMIPQPGLQTYMSAGVFAKYRFVSAQFNPEFVLAANKMHSGYMGPLVTDQMWMVWYEYYNRIDMPERFGNGPYARAFWGQSSIRLNFDEWNVPLSIGLSNENLWWGPGMRNSLLMSNTAPGFAHVTLNTTRPIKTPIGSFETQMIGGHLQNSGYPPRPYIDYGGMDRFYRPKPEGWRYISGWTFNYQPKWVPGLFLGFTRSFIVNQEDMGNKLSDYLPFFNSFLKSNYDDPATGVNEEDLSARDQYVSLSARWVMPKANAEVYFEFGRNDHAYNFRDLVGQLDHSRAYIIGLRKLVPLNTAKGTMLQINGEITQLEMTRAADFREGLSWYTHYQVRAGYTNLGQILGAGIGPGSNLQSLNVSWLKGIKQIGLQLERYVHNNDFYYNYIRNPRQNWVDLSAAAHGEWDYKNFIFTGKIQYMRAFNYQYKLLDYTDDRYGTNEFIPNDINNWHLQFGAMYRF